MVRGYVKHASYGIGDELTANESFPWSAVLIDGSWHLINLFWSARTPNSDYDETYFLSSPEEFIYSHLPEDDKWQLLARPVSREEFIKMARLTSDFFRYGFQLESHRQCVLSAASGSISIKLRVPKNANYKFKYEMMMTTTGNAMVATHNDIDLNRYVFMECRDSSVYFDIQFPISGKFQLIFKCLDMAKSEYAFSPVCTYIINATQVRKDVKSLPKIDRCLWGPGPELTEVGIRPITYKHGKVVAESEEVELKFATEYDVNFVARVYSNKRTWEHMNTFLYYRIENDQIVVNVKLPEAANYALDIYAKVRVEGENNASMPKVCSYLLSASKPAKDPSPFPVFGLLGPTAQMNALEVKAVSHPSAFVRITSAQQVNFLFKSTTACAYSAELKSHKSNEETDMDDYRYVDKQKYQVTLRTRFPEIGQYTLKLYGNETGKESEHLLLFTYLIAVDRPTFPCSPFPTIFPSWTDECEILKPDIDSHLFPDKIIVVTVRIPRALDVAVIRKPGNEWTHLTKLSADQWNGDLDTGLAGDELFIAASFKEGASSFTHLVKFKVSWKYHISTKTVFLQ